MDDMPPSPDDTPPSAPASTALGTTVTAPVTYSIILINVVVFAVMVFKHVPAWSPNADQLRAWGASFGPMTVTSTDATRHAEPWRIFTMMFVHGGAAHLGVNMLAFVGLGRTVERLVGSVALAWVYVMCGLAGALASMYAGPLATGVGASGAILGVAGFLLVLVLRRRVRLAPASMSRLASTALVFLAMTFALGFSTTGIDNAAHAGGALCGALVGLLVPPLEGRSRKIVIGRMAAIVVPLGALGVIDARHVAAVPAVRAERLYHEAYAQANELHLDDAIVTMTEAITLLPEATAPHVARGLWYEATSKNKEAESDYDIALEHEADNAIARERRCVLRAERRDLDRAREDCDFAVRLASETTGPWIARARVSLLEQKWPAAISDLTNAIRIDPKLALAYRARAAAQLAAGDKAASLRDIEHVASLEPTRADVYVSWVQLLVDSGTPDRAVTVATQAIAAFPREPRLLLARAGARASLGDFSAARDDAKTAAEIAPTLAVARNAHAWYLRLSGDARSAVTEASQAMELAPDSGAVADTRCWARFEAGDPTGATADCLHAIELDGTLKPTLGLLAYMRGDYEVAVRAWEEASAANVTEGTELAPWIARAKEKAAQPPLKKR